MANRNFKVGDKLRIREWDDMKSEFGIDKDYDGEEFIPNEFHFCEAMKPMCGKDFTVSEIYSGISYSSEENTEYIDNVRYNISADMLEYRKDKDYNTATDDEFQMLFA